jgi:methionyl-tRNA synthetase
MNNNALPGSSVQGTKLSKSRGAFVEVPYFLSKYDPDALRFYLTATAPETRDTPAAVLLSVIEEEYARLEG